MSHAIYKFLAISKTNKKDAYVRRRAKKIQKLLRKCHHSDYVKLLDIEFVKDGNLFICTTGKGKIIGISTGKYLDNIIFTKNEIDTYNNFKYTYIPSNCEKQFTICDPDDFREFKVVKLGPCIEYICKDPSYDNVGEFMLRCIERYYKRRGKHNVYIIIESIAKKSMLEQIIEATTDKLSFVGMQMIADGYVKSQMPLIEYFKGHGYSIAKHYYDISLMPQMPIAKDVLFCMFFNIMKKKVSKT